jgi:hypothetical protein
VVLYCPTRIELSPVVEIEPMGEGLALPVGSARENPQGWSEYWTAGISARGYSRVKAIEPGSWFVELDAMDERSLETLLREKLADCEGPVEIENIGALNGGYALRADEKVLLTPSCCGDLANLDGWKQASRYAGSDWQMLWIGHPWVSVRAAESLLVISDYHEDDREIVPLLAVQPHDLELAVARAKRLTLSFAERLVPFVARIFPRAPAGRVVKQLTGLCGDGGVIG